MSGLRRALVFLIVLVCLFTQRSAWGAERNKPGAFDYYVLVLSWMPSYCRGEGRSRKDGQCDTSKPHAFLLHGLWPQYEKGWPENCPIGKRPWVPAKLIEEMRDVMPSKSLIIHEYRVHGTCSGLEPEQYFGVARQLYERVSLPARFLAPDADRLASPDEIEREFLAANPWLDPDMISVTCRRANLLDIRVCFGRDLFPRSCGVNEDQKRLCPAAKITVPPVTP
ncbi:MAG: ribonuclease T2 family protein [Methyloceanibacter sp.]